MSPSPRGAISLRALMLVGAVAALTFVVVVAVQVVFVIVPTATALRGRSQDLLVDHDHMAENLAHLQDVRRTLSQAVPPYVAGVVREVDLDAVRDTALALLERGSAARAAIERADIPLEMRLHLADAAGLEAAIAVALLDAQRAIVVGRDADAITALRYSGTLTDSTTRVLSRAQRVALASLLDDQEAMLASLTSLEWWLRLWTSLGIIAFVVGAWVLRQRLYVPVREMERAVRRITGGDLSTEVSVRHSDELGRLAKHINAMTQVLRERVEDESRKRENLTERFGRILDASASEICVFDAHTLTLLQANRGARERLGLDDSTLGAMRLPDLISGLPEDRLRTVLDELSGGRQSRTVLTTWMRRRDGSLYPAEMTVQSATDAETSVFITVTEDASVRRQVRVLDERLRAFAIEHQDLLTSGDALAALRPLTAMACDALDADLCGIWRAGAFSTEPMLVFDARTGAHDSAARPTPDEDDFVTRLPLRVSGRDLAQFVLVRHERALNVEESTFALALADLATRVLEGSERRTLEQALARAQRMDSIGQLAGGVAHDFNNLLTAILGNLEASRQSLEPGSTMDEALAEAEHAALRAADLTRQLLTFARQQVLETRAVRVESRIVDAEAMLRRLIGPDRTLVLKLTSPLGSVRLGSGQLEQLLVNLVVNARDATVAGDTIEITARMMNLDATQATSAHLLAPGAHLELIVRDTGRGMDARTLERIFEPFFTTKGVGEGTGLGLAVCYGIVRNAGGVIQVTSEVGKGAQFRLLMPAASERESPGAGTAVRLIGHGECVLVAEDEPAIRTLVSRMLASRGFRVLAAENGEAALALADAEPGPIALLVTDVVMPRMGGIELAHAMRARRPGVRVLFMSGYAASSSLQQGEFADAAFLAKPFTTDELTGRIAELVAPSVG